MSVFGRTGEITAQAGDYSLNLLSDVDFSTAPNVGDVLSFNGSKWIPSVLTIPGETDPSVQGFAKVLLPVCPTGQVLTSTNGTNFQCISSGSSVFTGAPNTAVITNASGNLVSSSVTSTELNHLSGVSSSIQTQLDSKLALNSSLARDVSGPYDNLTVNKLQNLPLEFTAPASGDVLVYDGSKWVNKELEEAVMPDLNADKITSGVLPIARGGTNSGAALTGNKMMLSTTTSIVEGPGLLTDHVWVGTITSPVGKALVGTSGITITHEDDKITFTGPGTSGTLTGITASAPMVVNNTNPASPGLSINQSSGSTDGYLSSGDWNTFNNKLSSSLNSGNIFVGNGSHVATAVAISGDATLSNTGVLTLQTVSLSKGGTGATTQAGAANNILPPQAGNSGKALITNGSDASWGNVLSAEADTLNSVVGRGSETTTLVGLNGEPLSPEVVSGIQVVMWALEPPLPVQIPNLVWKGQIRSKSFSITSGSVDWSLGNAGTTSFDCGSSLAFANLRDGGSYSLVVTGASTSQCNFSTTITGDDAGTVSFRFMPANGVRQSNSHTIYSFQRIGDVVYVSWISGF